MNINELRVGNWVDFLIPGKHMKIYSIEGNGMVICDDGKGYTAERNVIDLLPVPITDELLEKAGFIGKENFYSIGKDGLWLHRGKWLYGDIEKEVKCIHQLQNLHFALYDEELEINL